MNLVLNNNLLIQLV